MPLEASRLRAEQLQQRAVGLEASQYSIGDELKKRVTEAYEANQDLIGQADVATQEYLQAPQVGREQYQDIFDPFAREKLVSQYTGQQAVPMLAAQSMLGQRFGRIEDLVGAGTRQFQAQATAAQGQAGIARQSYQDLLGQYQWEQEMGLKRQQEARQAGAGAGPSLFDALQAIGGVQNLTPEMTATLSFMFPKESAAIGRGYKTVVGAREAEQEERSLLTGLAGLKTSYSKLGLGEKAPGIVQKVTGKFLPDVAGWRSAVDMVGMRLARMVESGRLSDRDRDFYMGQLPTGWETDAVADRKIDTVIENVETKLEATRETYGAQAAGEWDFVSN